MESNNDGIMMNNRDFAGREIKNYNYTPKNDILCISLLVKN